MFRRSLSYRALLFPEFHSLSRTLISREHCREKKHLRPSQGTGIRRSQVCKRFKPDGAAGTTRPTWTPATSSTEYTLCSYTKTPGRDKFRYWSIGILQNCRIHCRLTIRTGAASRNLDGEVGLTMLVMGWVHRRTSWWQLVIPGLSHSCSKLLFDQIPSLIQSSHYLSRLTIVRNQPHGSVHFIQLTQEQFIIRTRELHRDHIRSASCLTARHLYPTSLLRTLLAQS